MEKMVLQPMLSTNSSNTAEAMALPSYVAVPLPVVVVVVVVMFLL